MKAEGAAGDDPSLAVEAFDTTVVETSSDVREDPFAVFLDRVSGPDERRQPRRLRPVDPLVELASGDVWSRKVVGWRVFDREDNELSAKAFVEIYEAEGADPEKLVLHSDNGGPMKGATMVATLESLGVTRSLSRPSVSNDDPFVESTFRTVKGRPSFPDKPFESLDAAETWVAEFVAWYNEEHRHSGISFVTPGQRHTRVHEALLEHREHVYAAAKARHPERWTGNTRRWDRHATVRLNPTHLPSRGQAATPDTAAA